MTPQKPVADHWKKIHIAAITAAFAAVAAPTLSPVYHWLFPKEKLVAVNDKAETLTPPSLQQH